MNKYELRASQERKSAFSKSILIWTVGAALVLATIVFLSYNNSLPTRSKTIIVLAVLVLAWRQIARRVKTKGVQPVEPDPQSRLNLD